MSVGLHDLPNFRDFCEAACVKLWGEPDSRNARELRWNGADAYSAKTFNRQKKAWYDHGEKRGGSTLDLVAYDKGQPKHDLKGSAFFDAWTAAHAMGLVPDEPPAKANGQGGSILATYPYHDEAGQPLFEVVRFDATDSDNRFRQRRPDGAGGWIWDTKGVRSHILYRLPTLIEALKAGQRVLITEGEHDCNTAVALGFVATTMPGGVGKWRSEYDHFFQDADVVIVSDNDPQSRDKKTGALQFHPDGKPKLPGQDHAAAVARHMRKVAARVRVVIFPQKDLTAWREAGGTTAALEALIDSTPDLIHLPPPAPEPDEDENAAGNIPAYSDEALALKFADRHANDLRFVPLWSKWLLWDGSRWRLDDRTVAFTRARIVCREVAASYKGKRAAGVASGKTVAAVGALARGDPRHVAIAAQWDARLTALSMPARSMNLETGLDYRPDPLDYSTKSTAVAAAPEKTSCPLWIAFLRKVTGEDELLIHFLQRFLGYCLSGLVTEHSLLFLFGTGSNGKSVFTSVLTWILGDYAIIAPMEMFVATRQERHPTEIARLRGARLVVAHETQKGRRWDESKLKTLTGGDPISGRFMRGDFFDFQPTHKFILAGNHKPGFSTIDEAIRRRFLLVPFTVCIPKEERDPELTEKLKAEGPAILRWMIDGYIEWRCDGLMVPKSVSDATEAYLADQDAFGQWVEETIERVNPAEAEDDAFVKTRDLFKSWKGWCDDRNLYPGTETAFADSLKDRGYRPKRTEKARGFKWIRIKFDADPPSGDDPSKPESEPWETRY